MSKTHFLRYAYKNSVLDHILVKYAMRAIICIVSILTNNGIAMPHGWW
jgi:hypothetical protein